MSETMSIRRIWTIWIRILNQKKIEIDPVLSQSALTRPVSLSGWCEVRFRRGNRMDFWWIGPGGLSMNWTCGKSFHSGDCPTHTDWVMRVPRKLWNLMIYTAKRIGTVVVWVESPGIHSVCLKKSIFWILLASQHEMFVRDPGECT